MPHLFLRLGLVLVIVLLGLFAWRAWRPMPNAALLAAAVALVGGVFLLRAPVALVTAGLLTWVCCWAIKKNRS